jgi:hypothetical protein
MYRPPAAVTSNVVLSDESARDTFGCAPEIDIFPAILLAARL